MLLRSGVPYVVDYDDATFHQYDRHPNLQIRRLLGGKIAEVMRGAATVVVGNQYLGDYARSSGAGCVEYVPTAVDIRQYTPVDPGAERVGFTIGWIGTPLTAAYLEAVRPALARVCDENPCTVRLVGAGEMDWSGINVLPRPWSEATEVGEIQTFSAGIMPLPDAPFERGKCGYKLIQCMACGVPVAASPVGVNRTLIRHGQNGFLAESEDEWISALSGLRHDVSLRTRMGAAARRTIEQEFSTAVTAPHLARILTSAAKMPRQN
jgi:glycosyltransferase involved in cell wall biosynthesis